MNPVLYSMAKSKEVLDRHGKPIPGLERVKQRRGEFRIETDPDGKKYWRAYTQDGKPGDRLPVDGPDAPYIEVTNSETGETLYDSRIDEKNGSTSRDTAKP